MAYTWVITQDLDNPYDEDPDQLGLPSRVGMSGPSTATETDILHALNTGAFFRLLDDDGNAYYVGRCWSSDAPTVGRCSARGTTTAVPTWAPPTSSTGRTAAGHRCNQRGHAVPLPAGAPGTCNASCPGSCHPAMRPYLTR